MPKINKSAQEESLGSPIEQAVNLVAGEISVSSNPVFICGVNRKVNIGNFENISDSLSRANVKQTIEETNRALSQANQIFDQINKGQGTLGKLVKNDSLYNNLNRSAEDLDKLMKDLRINPERYLHLSVFGRKDRNKPKD